MIEFETVREFLFIVAQALIVLAIPILVFYGAGYLRQRLNEVKQRVSKEQLEMLEKVGQLAVTAAEQAGLSGQLRSGSEKRTYAMRAAQSYLDRLGIRVDAEAIGTLIEAEVLKQFNGTATPMADTAEARSRLLEKAVESAVLAAEKTGLSGELVRAGVNIAREKKGFALDFAGRYLKEHGINIDVSVVDGLIEAQLMRFQIEAAKEVGAR